MNIELCAECQSRLIAQDLIGIYRTIETSSRNMFSLDEEENEKEVRKLKKALKRVIEYYGGEL